MIVSTTYAINSLAWSVVGFVAGVGAGRAWKAEMRTVFEKIKSLLHRVKIGWALIALSIATVVFVFVQNQGLENKARCQAEYSNNLSKVIKTRSQYTDSDRENLVTLLETIASTSATSQQNVAFSRAVQAYAEDPTSKNLVAVFQILAQVSKNDGGAKQTQALQKFLRETAEADSKRAKHPLPTLSEKCGT